MAPTNVELYEALKPSVGELAARMIAEAVPAAQDLATKSDIQMLRSELLVFKNELQAEIQSVRSDLRVEIHTESTRQMRWMLTFFIPVWAGTWATVVAVILKS